MPDEGDIHEEGGHEDDGDVGHVQELHGVSAAKPAIAGVGHGDVDFEDLEVDHHEEEIGRRIGELPPPLTPLPPPVCNFDIPDTLAEAYARAMREENAREAAREAYRLAMAGRELGSAPISYYRERMDTITIGVQPE